LRFGRPVSYEEDVVPEQVFREYMKTLTEDAIVLGDDIFDGLNRYPFNEHIYRALIPMLDVIYYSEFVDGIFYYIKKTGERYLMCIEEEWLDEGWQVDQASTLFPGVWDIYYFRGCTEEEDYLACSFGIVPTYVRYYPATERWEAVYHKALLGVDEYGREKFLDQPLEVIEQRDWRTDYCGVHHRGKIGEFELDGDVLVCRTEYLSEGIVDFKDACIKPRETQVFPRTGQVHYELSSGTYVILLPKQIGMEYIKEIEENFDIGSDDISVRFEHDWEDFDGSENLLEEMWLEEEYRWRKEWLD